jgi:putative Holliday junction resolvase
MRRLGIDPGTARTGLAVADDEIGVATPLTTVAHRSLAEAVRAIAAIAAREAIEVVVIGLPLALDGREGEAARRARAFASALRKQSRIRVVLWDERLSTVSAERALRAQGVRGADKKRVIDQAAATLLLQSYMDGRRARPWEPETIESEPQAHKGPNLRTKNPREPRARKHTTGHDGHNNDQDDHDDHDD